MKTTKSALIFQTILVYFGNCLVQIEDLRQYLKNQPADFSQSTIFDDLLDGSLVSIFIPFVILEINKILFNLKGNYLTYDETLNLDSLIFDAYGDWLVYKDKIGQSYQKRPIFQYTILDLSSEQDWKKEMSSRVGILIDGAHHAREVTTISMVYYTWIRLLHAFEHQDPTIKTLLKNTAITFIPIVNPDGV